MILKKQSLFILICFSLVLTLFHNCGQFANVDNSINSACSADMLPTFKNTFYIFFKDNKCTKCHSPESIDTKVGIPQFAAGDAALGLSYFSKLGPDKIIAKLSAGHNGYDYTSLKTTLSDYKTKWNNKLNAASGSCTDENGIPELSKSVQFFEDTLEYNRYKVLPDMLTWQTVTWSLDNGKSEMLKDVSITLDIMVQADAFRGPEAYIVSNLKMISPNKILHIKGVTVLLNDQTYSVSTYQGVDIVLNPLATPQDLAPGSAAGVFVIHTDEIYKNSDGWKVHFDSIVDETPAPPEEN
jgi:hypothetical protein